MRQFYSTHKFFLKNWGVLGGAALLASPRKSVFYDSFRLNSRQTKAAKLASK
jgi:hypothetical protein